MAAGTLPSPGTNYGPCKTKCCHLDCAATRQQAETHCARCWKAIGYETPFYRLSDGRLAHAECEEDALRAGVAP